MLMAQSADWDTVRRISRGTPIAVKAWRNAKCEFRDATDEQLFCDDLRSGDVLIFNRRDIRQIRREFTTQAKGQLGAVIGAGVGATVGAAVHDDKSGYTRGGNAMFTALMGGCAGWLFARNVPVFHRRVIYRR
jgi:hypothetical protein